MTKTTRRTAVTSWRGSPSMAHAHDEFLVVATVRTSNGVRAVNNFQIFVSESLFERVQDDGDALFHEGKALLVVVADAQIFFFVFEVVLQDEADVRVVIGTALGHEREDVV